MGDIEDIIYSENEDIVEDEVEEVDDFEDDIDEAEELDAEDVEHENFEEVLSLTEYDGNLKPVRDSDFVIADYKAIKPTEIDKAYFTQAKNFVNRITKFISDFDDQNLTDEHQKYLKEVAKLQITHLADLLTLVNINKQMMCNIIERVNVTQAEDYAIINSYNNLVNQHLKLLKELSAHYKAIPATIKKMRNDVIQEDRLNSGDTDEIGGVVTEDFGKSQFNNQKQLLRAMLDKQKENKDNVNNIN